MVEQVSQISQQPGKSKRLQILVWLNWAAFALLGLIVAVRLVSFFQINLAWLPYPLWRPGSEGLVLDETLRVRQGLPIYGQITQTSFISGPYPPVFYYITAFLMNFVGEGMLAGRLVAFASALFCAVLVGLIIWRESRLVWPSLLLGLTLLLTSPFLIWASRNRGDVLMVAFNLAGLYLVGLLNDGRGTTMPISNSSVKNRTPSVKPSNPTLTLLSILFFGLALYTKQTGLAAPLAATVWLLTKNWRLGLKYCALLGVGLILPFAALEIVTHHEFYRHMVSYHALPWHWNNFVGWVGVFGRDNLVLVVIGGGFSLIMFGDWILSWRKQVIFNRADGQKAANQKIEARHSLKESAPPLSAWFYLFGLTGLITTGVEGADHNHLLLPAAAVCVATGTALAKGAKTVLSNYQSCYRSYLALKLLGIGFTLLLAAQLWLGWAAMLKNYNFDLAPQLSTSEQAQMSRIVDSLKTVKGPILSEEVALPALAGKESQVTYNDVYTLGLLAQAGQWNSDGLAQAVRHKKFAVILVPFDLNSQRALNHKVWPPSVLQAIKDNYQVKFRDLWYTYVPKP